MFARAESQNITIGQKLNVIPEFEHAYYDCAVQRFNHFAILPSQLILIIYCYILSNIPIQYKWISNVSIWLIDGVLASASTVGQNEIQI